MKNILLIILIAFTFNACATKEIDTNNNIKPAVKETQAVVEEDEFADEFADEFSQTEEKQEIFDPLSGYNRVMTSFNDVLFINVLNPVAKGYANVVPKPVRSGISNVFDNLLFPIRFTNNLLQLKFKNASEELGRFVINSTFGVFGIFDPAEYSFGLEAHPEDFGQTLGHYGVGSGFHIVLPVLGPSNLRDMFGLVPDYILDPTSTTGSNIVGYKIPKNFEQGVSSGLLNVVNTTSFRLGQYENLKKDAFDLYPFLRDVYEQKRAKDIKE